MIGHLSPALCTHSPTLCADSPTLGTHENRREGYISRNMAPRANMHKTKKFYFFILMKSYFIHICPRSHISRDMAVAAFFMCPQGWRISTQGWRMSAQGWRQVSYQLKTGTVPVFNQNSYRTRAIITRGLYTFYPLFEFHLCTVTFALIYG